LQVAVVGVSFRGSVGIMRSARLLAVAVLAVVLVACSFRPALAFIDPQGIIVYEVTTNNDATTVFHFTVFSNPIEFTVTGGSQWSSDGKGLVVGSHIIRQTVPPGWVLTGISCNYGADVVSAGAGVFAAGSLGVASYGPQFAEPQYDLADHSVTLYIDTGFWPVCTFTDAPAPVAAAPVGGIVEPVNQLAVVGSYFALAGLIAAATVVAVVFWKRPDN
jgi:hypothetical protein